MLKISIILCLSIFLVIFLSCDSNIKQSQPDKVSDSTVIDTLAVLNDPKNNLSVQTSSFSEIDSSGILMFPLSIGESKRDGGSYYYKEIPAGSYWNIIFYNSNTSVYHVLSDRKMLISGIGIKYSGSIDNIERSSSKTHLFYKVRVDDYNQDKLLTTADPEYLFISDKTGNNFKQISPPGYDLHSWQFLKSSNKIIMTVTKDTDNDKKFGDEDEVTTFQIDIDNEDQPAEILSADFKKKLKLMFDRDWKRKNK